MPDDVLTEIAKKLRDKELILFVGSGMSAPCLPTWSGLLLTLQTEAFKDDEKAAAEVAQMIHDKQFLNAAWAIQHKSGGAWRKYIEQKFKGTPCATPADRQTVEGKYAALKGLPFASVVTTNYDDFLLGALPQTPITHEDEDQIAAMPGSYQLLKLHGTATKPLTLILTSTDFTKLKHGSDAVDDFMHTAAKTHSFLFLGYSFEDEDVLFWLERAYYRARGNIKGHYGLVDDSKWGNYKKELYRQRYGIEMVNADLVGGYPDIEAFLRKLHDQYNQVRTVSLRELFRRPMEWPESIEYVDPQIEKREAGTKKDKSLHSLDKFLIEWLKCEDGTRQFLVLLGEFGTGKTQFSYRAHQLVLKHSHRAPVLVKLGQFHTGADPAAIAAAAAPTDVKRFLDSNRSGDLVLILDAFDEMGKANRAQSLDQSFEKLTSGLVAGKARVILTCRKEFFRTEDEEQHLPSDKVIAATAEKVEVQLFDETRVQKALERRNRTEVFDQIHGNPRVLDLARRPVLLDLIAQYNRPFDANTKLADLYEKYIDKMLERGPDDRHAYQRREFAEEIAWKMQNSGPKPAIELESRLKELGFEADADRFRSRSLLVRQVNDYVFGHTSFREYLVAKQVVPYLKEDKFVECKLSNPTIEFIREMWTWTPPQPVEKDGMLWIPPGPFIFGEADSARLANLDQGFWIDRYPVTNQQFLEFLQSVGKKKIDPSWIEYQHSRITESLTLVDSKYQDHPVNGVSWFGVKAYAEAATKRLPTEEEWEKAARGMDGRLFPWGDTFDIQKANTRQSVFEDTSPTKQHAAGKSPYGVVDMAGNVWEWTATEEGGVRVLRGGSWRRFLEGARCAYRLMSYRELTDGLIGFRCART